MKYCFAILKSLFFVFVFSVVFLIPENLYAGGGPENVFLVVNRTSKRSKTIANYYARIRNIPTSNLLEIDWAGDKENCTSQEFKEKILLPIIKAIEQRGLVRQIDYIVYSVDFPWRVNFIAEMKEKKVPKQHHPIASLTGATYLWQYSLFHPQSLMSLNSNWYVPQGAGILPQSNIVKCQRIGSIGSRGFKGSTYWNAKGEIAKGPKLGQRYFICSMLGVSTGRGNTTQEIMRYLKQAKKIDGTSPQGSFYFVKNSNVRSTTRHGGYAEMVAEIKKLGHRAKVLDGIMPNNKRDVAGVMMGTSVFDWKKSNSRIMPGAFCDHLTSYSGDLKKAAPQTALNEFLKNGAAGASGTVWEPYALQAKFPLPSVQLHYVRGCSLGEAFYQSVQGPYQILLVGDPLCQPWADLPKLKYLEGTNRRHVKETFTFRLKFESTKTKHLEVYLDGRLFATLKPHIKQVTLPTALMRDGFHELRVVVVGKTKIASQGSVTKWFKTENHGLMVSAKLVGPPDLVPRTAATIKVSSPGAVRIELLCFGRKIATLVGEEGQFELKSQDFGKEESRFQAVAIHVKENKKDEKPREIEVLSRMIRINF